MMAFRVKKAAALPEVWQWMKDDPGACMIAGGTDRIPRINQGIERHETLICLDGIKGLRGVYDGGTYIRVGALTKLAEVGEEPLLAPYRALRLAAGHAASPPIRNQATLGGNILQENRCMYFNQSVSWRRIDPCFKLGGNRCYQYKGSPKCVALFQSDLAPALMAYGAGLVFESPAGQREAPIRALYLPAGEKDRRPEEVLVEARLPKPLGALHSAYARETLRGSFDFPIISCAVAVEVERGVIAKGAMALGSAGAQPQMVEEMSALAGMPLSKLAGETKNLAAAGRKKIAPFRDNHTDAAVRWAMGEAAIQSALEQIIKNT